MVLGMVIIILILNLNMRKLEKCFQIISLFRIVLPKAEIQATSREAIIWRKKLIKFQAYLYTFLCTKKLEIFESYMPIKHIMLTKDFILSSSFYCFDMTDCFSKREAYIVVFVPFDLTFCLCNWQKSCMYLLISWKLPIIIQWEY